MKQPRRTTARRTAPARSGRKPRLRKLGSNPQFITSIVKEIELYIRGAKPEECHPAIVTLLEETPKPKSRTAAYGLSSLSVTAKRKLSKELDGEKRKAYAEALLQIYSASAILFEKGKLNKKAEQMLAEARELREKMERVT